MHKISSSFIALTTALTLMVGACGGDATGINSGDELTTEEVAAVMAALASGFDSVGVAAQIMSEEISASDIARVGPVLAPISVNESFDVSIPCESGTLDLGGSMSGTIDDETFAMDVVLGATWDPKGCVVSDGTTTFTVDGAPRVEVSVDMTSTEDALTLNGTEIGGFSYTSSDGRSGSCAIDVTFSIVTGEQSVTSEVSGTVCGLEGSAFATLGT